MLGCHAICNTLTFLLLIQMELDHQAILVNLDPPHILPCNRNPVVRDRYPQHHRVWEGKGLINHKANLQEHHQVRARDLMDPGDHQVKQDLGHQVTHMVILQ